MAEGEDLIDFRDPDNTGDDDEQEVNRTGAFVPGAFEPYEASTPYHGGEQINFQTTMHEQSGLSEPSYEETAFWGGAQGEIRRSWYALARFFPRARATDLETSYSKTGRLQVKMSGFGKKNYPLFTKDKYTGKEQLNPGLTKEIENSLGSSAGDIIAEDQTNIEDSRKKISQYEEQQRQDEALVAEREKNNKKCKIFHCKIKDYKQELMPFKMNMVALLKINQNLIG